MIIVPNDVKCEICSKIFCCSDCQLKHKKSNHKMEIELMREREYFKSICHLCNGEPLPFPVTAFGLLHHINEAHLPLKCDKCFKVFENAQDLKDSGSCNHSASKTKLETVQEEIDKEVPQIMVMSIVEENAGENLSSHRINLRRKSVDFDRTTETGDTRNNEKSSGGLERQTSTPMVPILKTTFSMDPSASAIQISSINSTSRGSPLTMESSDFSPMQIQQQKCNAMQIPLTISPKRNAKRQKMAVEATPLRQVMSKSIQRAMAEHGHYRQSAYIAQRKMSFSSSNSSNDTSLSLQKFQTSYEAPLDLRLSPAIRRYSDDVVDESKQNRLPSSSEITETIEFKQIEVIIRRSAIQSDTTTSSSSHFKSCISDSERSESMPEIQFTPKIIGSNLLKKTISFETPVDLETTPIMHDMKENCEDDEVFFTPRASPIKTSRFEQFKKEEEEKPKKIWSLVRKLSENISESLSNEKMWKFQFKKPEFMKKAQVFFSSRETSSEGDEQPQKRRRTSSSNEPKSDLQMSPALKRQKIQGRKPINRMRLS